jgi:hypothetical protein
LSRLPAEQKYGSQRGESFHPRFTASCTPILRPGPDWDEENVEFLSMCVSTRCARHSGDHDPGGRAPRGAVILTVDAAAMHAARHAFYQAANGVWLTDQVPPGYLSG